MMRVSLFIPCYVDQLYPQVGMATVELLEQFGCQVDFPTEQTCCGQPMANTGCVDDARPLALKFLKVFAGSDYIVCPSGSCTAMIRQHYAELLHGDERYPDIRAKTFELCEFLYDVLKVRKIPGSFPYRVGLHSSCHGLRELRLASSSELVISSFNKAGELLGSMEDISLCTLKRADECCGFGGTFAVAEEAVSCMMGLDRIHDHESAGAQVITAGDMSCLMHLQGIIQRQSQLNPYSQKRPLKVMHIAEILAGRKPD